jgi:hypothetical protein
MHLAAADVTGSDYLRNRYLSVCMARFFTGQWLFTSWVRAAIPRDGGLTHFEAAEYNHSGVDLTFVLKILRENE